MHHLPAQMTSTETLRLTRPPNPPAVCLQALSSVSHYHFICHLLLLYCLLSFDFVKEAFFVFNVRNIYTNMQVQTRMFGHNIANTWLCCTEHAYHIRSSISVAVISPVLIGVIDYLKICLLLN